MAYRYLKPFLAVAGLLMAATTAGAQTSTKAPGASAAPAPDAKPLVPPEMMARYEHAKWSYPGSDQMADAYPPKAQVEEVSGMAKIVCLVAADGYLDKCAVMNETPKGYDFGLETATLFVKYCHVDPATVDGGVKAGDYKVFIYKWQLG